MVSESEIDKAIAIMEDPTASKADKKWASKTADQYVAQENARSEKHPQRRISA